MPRRRGSAALSRRRGAPWAGIPERARALAGRHLAVIITQLRCNSCHGLDLAGRENIPYIADQREDYLVKTLRDYKSNSRHG